MKTKMDAFGFEKIKEVFRQWVPKPESGKRKISPALLLGLLGLLLLLPGLFGGEKEEAGNPSPDLQIYENRIEEQLTTLLEQMEGVGEVYVMVTLEGGEETVYVSGKNQVERVKLPGICGVAVICRGAKTADVRERVISAVATVLGIGWDQVSVEPLEGKTV